MASTLSTLRRSLEVKTLNDSVHWNRFDWFGKTSIHLNHNFTKAPAWCEASWMTARIPVTFQFLVVEASNILSAIIVKQLTLHSFSSRYSKHIATRMALIHQWDAPQSFNWLYFPSIMPTVCINYLFSLRFGLLSKIIVFDHWMFKRENHRDTQEWEWLVANWQPFINWPKMRITKILQ